MYSFEYREKFRNIILSYLKDRGEVWAFHPEYENILVSSFGKVKNASTGTEFSQRETRQGYMTCSIPMFQTIGIKKNRSKLVHRLVAETFFVYLKTTNYEVNHINGNKKDNSIYNINWMTRQENLEHAQRTGLLKPRIGKLNGMYKYSDEDIKVLDNLRKEGYTLKQIGFLLDIKEGSVRNILKRRIK